MKNTFLLLLLLSLPQTSPAQNWALISPDRKLNYGTQGSDAVGNTLRIEEVLVLGGDSVFIPNPRPWIFDTISSFSAHIDYFLGDTIFKRAKGVYEFRKWGFNHYQAPFFIHTQAQPGESWAFRDTLTAKVVSVESEQVLGTPDSVKTIALSDGTILRLSKNFGIYQFGDYHLLGLEGEGIGVQLPNALEWYDWAVGDVYEYFEQTHYYTSNYTLGADIWTKIYVQSIKETPSTLNFTVRKLTREVNYYNGSSLDTSYSDNIDSLPVENIYDIDYPGIASSSHLIYRYRQTGPHTLKKEIYQPTGYWQALTDVYETGLGQTYSFVESGAQYWSSTETTALRAHWKTGQTQQGPLHPDAFYKPGYVGQKEENAEKQLSVYPNPARGFFRVAFGVPVEGTGCRIVLFDALGRAVKQVTLPEGAASQTVPVDDLPPGNYVLGLFRENGIEARTWVVVTR